MLYTHPADVPLFRVPNVKRVGVKRVDYPNYPIYPNCDSDSDCEMQFSTTKPKEKNKNSKDGNVILDFINVECQRKSN
jgi:hypothetical protein